MILGVGVDMVSISQMKDILDDMNQGERACMFTQAEVARSCDVPDAAEYLATRFAAKEAVTKAFAPLLTGTTLNFDMRIVETLNRADGSPYVSMNDEMKTVCSEAGVSHIHISLTTEDNFACAFAVVERV